MVYVKGEKYKKLYGVSTQTLRSWADNGKVDSVRTPGGVRLYKLPEAQHLQLQNQAAQLSISYIRVSSGKQKDDLERQRTFMLDRFPDNEVIADIGSGVNWKRKGLLAILDQANRGNVKEVVVASRDRLCRFAFELLEYILKQRGVQLTVLDSKDASAEEELSDDLLSIVQIFCCRKNGKRRYASRPKDAKDKAEPHEGPEDDVK
jgi:predicted site-specific integrase-resolvase